MVLIKGFVNICASLWTACKSKDYDLQSVHLLTLYESLCATTTIYIQIMRSRLIHRDKRPLLSSQKTHIVNGSDSLNDEQINPLQKHSVYFPPNEEHIPMSDTLINCSSLWYIYLKIAWASHKIPAWHIKTIRISACLKSCFCTERQKYIYIDQMET